MEEELYNQFIAKTKIPGRLLFGRLGGSRSYNLNHENSDRDYGGVYIMPTRDFVSLSPPPDILEGTSADKVKNPDHAFYEIFKFCNLLIKGNPTIIEMLFTNKNSFVTNEWNELKEHRVEFLTKKCVLQYLGYLNGQLERL